MQVDRCQKSVREFFKSDESNLGPNQGQDGMKGGINLARSMNCSIVSVQSQGWEDGLSKVHTTESANCMQLQVCGRSRHEKSVSLGDVMGAKSSVRQTSVNTDMGKMHDETKQPNCVTGGEKADSGADVGTSRPEFYNISSPISKKNIPKTRSVDEIQKMFQLKGGGSRKHLEGVHTVSSDKITSISGNSYNSQSMSWLQKLQKFRAPDLEVQPAKTTNLTEQKNEDNP